MMSLESLSLMLLLLLHLLLTITNDDLSTFSVSVRAFFVGLYFCWALLVVSVVHFTMNRCMLLKRGYTINHMEPRCSPAYRMIFYCGLRYCINIICQDRF